MKSTKSRAMISMDWTNANGEQMHTLHCTFDLSEDDLHIVLSIIEPAISKSTKRENDLGDILLTCLTYGIHKAYEEIEGVPFTLRMDRLKKKA